MMQPTKGLLLVSAVLLFLSPAAAQSGFDVSVETVNDTVKPGTGNAATIEITVTNTGDDTGKFSINYNGAGGIWWYSLDNHTLTLAPGESGTATLYAEPGDEAIAKNYGVSVTVTGPDGQQVRESPWYRVVRDRDIIITDIGTDTATYDPGQQIDVTVDVLNVRNRELPRNAYQVAVTFDGETYTESLPSLIASEPETVRTSFTAPRHGSGVMDISARVETLEGERHDTADARIRVREAPNLVTDRTSAFRLISGTTTIEVNNTGNTVADGTEVSAELPSYLSYFTSFSDDPVAVSSVSGMNVYTWDLGAVEPGESRTIRYRVNYWVPAAFLVLIVAALGLGIREYRRPAIAKRAARKDGTHAVHIRVANRSGKQLDDVTVRDRVPSIVSLIQKFDASPPERIRQGDEETEIEWNLGRLEPGEERILTYSISPRIAVEGGDITLPPAELAYGDDRRRSSGRANADFS